MRRKFGSGLAGAVVLLTLAACSSVPSSIPGMPEAIASAKTPEDHRGIADYFARKAVDYDAETAFHRKMFRSYSGARYGYSGSIIGHCRSLEEGFAEAAKDARALEQAHRQLAAAAATKGE